MAGFALQQAATMIAAGQARAVTIIYGNNGRVTFRPAGGRGTLWSWVRMHKEYFKGFQPSPMWWPR